MRRLGRKTKKKKKKTENEKFETFQRALKKTTIIKIATSLLAVICPHYTPKFHFFEEKSQF